YCRTFAPLRDEAARSPSGATRSTCVPSLAARLSRPVSAASVTASITADDAATATMVLKGGPHVRALLNANRRTMLPRPATRDPFHLAHTDHPALGPRGFAPIPLNIGHVPVQLSLSDRPKTASDS